MLLEHRAAADTQPELQSTLLQLIQWQGPQYSDSVVRMSRTTWATEMVESRKMDRHNETRPHKPHTQHPHGQPAGQADCRLLQHMHGSYIHSYRDHVAAFSAGARTVKQTTHCSDIVFLQLTLDPHAQTRDNRKPYDKDADAHKIDRRSNLPTTERVNKEQ
jgi:hypothetical protein